MSTITDIVNTAIGLLGLPAITDINQATAPARKAKLLFEGCRDSVLRAHSWGFATRHERLNLISDESVPVWDYLYAYPANALMIRAVYEEGLPPVAPIPGMPNPPQNRFEELSSPVTYQKVIGTNAPNAFAKFTARITDTSKYDAIFTETLSLYLAANLAIPLGVDAKSADYYLKQYTIKKEEAKSTNSNEKVSNIPTTSGFINAR